MSDWKEWQRGHHGEVVRRKDRDVPCSQEAQRGMAIIAGGPALNK
jgi:hypothetical protein